MCNSAYKCVYVQENKEENKHRKGSWLVIVKQILAEHLF